MSEFAGLTVLAVERFWRRLRTLRDPCTSTLESSLKNLIVDKDSKRSKAWASVLLLVACIETDLLEDVASLLTNEDASPQFPPDYLLGRVGFVFQQGRRVSLSDAQCNVEPIEFVLSAIRSIGVLNNQSIAEITIALSGKKVSRLVLSGHDLAILSGAIGFPIFVSSTACDAVADPELDGFSNIARQERLIHTVEPADQLYIYFGASIEDRANVAVLDRLNAAGEYLGIPDCCRDNFRTSWDQICEHLAGDVAFDLLSKALNRKFEGELKIPWQCNPYGMYKGGGLLWHFPCSLQCTETIALVDERFRLLQTIDQSFAKECRDYQTALFWLQESRRVTFEITGTPAALIVPI